MVGQESLWTEDGLEKRRTSGGARGRRETGRREPRVAENGVVEGSHASPREMKESNCQCPSPAALPCLAAGSALRLVH